MAQASGSSAGKSFFSRWGVHLAVLFFVTLWTIPTLGILVFTVLPLIFMISMAFTSYDRNHLVLFDWVGFDNFAAMFTDARLAAMSSPVADRIHLRAASASSHRPAAVPSSSMRW